MKTYRIAMVPGDGIGKEVVPAGRQVLEVLAGSESSFAFEFENFDWGGDYFRKHGAMMPESGLDALRGKDAFCSGPPGTRISPTTSRYGACGSRSARDWINTPTCARHVSFQASTDRSNAAKGKT